MITKDFTGGELDTLIALVERGPLEDGDVPSKLGRNTLIEMGFAMRIPVKGRLGYQAATDKGLKVYLERYNAETIEQAVANRKLARLAA